MASVDIVDSVALSIGWVGAAGWEGLDEVEEALVAVGTLSEGSTAGRVVTKILSTTSICF